jgi:dsRNA-specific ribonuclease
MQQLHTLHYTKLQVHDYQRLELLGDAVLSYLVVTQLFLHSEYGGDTPHIMTVKTSYCVRNSTLAVVGVKKLSLHNHIRLVVYIACI